jgi:hypothetical protein
MAQLIVVFLNSNKRSFSVPWFSTYCVSYVVSTRDTRELILHTLSVNWKNSFFLLCIQVVKVLNIGQERCPEIFLGFPEFHEANKGYCLWKRHHVVLSMQISK